MGNIIGAVAFFAIAIAILVVSGFIKVEPEYNKIKRWVSRTASAAFIVFAGLIGFQGALAYNDAGYCVHVRTIWGEETSKCNLGWYLQGWGFSTAYPHYITIAHTNDPEAEGSSIHLPYPIRMADQWSGTVSQTTRFGIPQDNEQFLRMAREFRSPEKLITSTLLTAVQASLDSTANLYSMEEYWAGGQRDAFKTDFRDAVIKGRPVVKRAEVTLTGAAIDRDVAPSDSDVAADTAITGSTERTRIITEKVFDINGNVLREPHGYAEYGITVSTAIVTNLDPQDEFEVQIEERKNAAARRTIAVEKRLEQEEQRLLAIAEGERKIAERQAAARTEQIEKTTNAETQKRLALIEAERIKEEASIAKQTAEIQLERARIDAEAVQVTADAAAYERQALLEADNALKLKLDAEIAIQKAWAEAYATRRVPQIVFDGNGETSDIPVGGDSEVSRFLNLLTIDAASRLAYDRGVGAYTNSVPAE